MAKFFIVTPRRLDEGAGFQVLPSFEAEEEAGDAFKTMKAAIAASNAVDAANHEAKQAARGATPTPAKLDDRELYLFAALDG